MKTLQRSKSFLPAAVLAASVLAGNATYTQPAHACGWDFWNCFDDAASWVWDKTKGVGNWFKETGKGIGQFAVRDIWGNLITSISCPFTTGDYYTVRLACFPSNSMQVNRLLAALKFMYFDTRSDFTYTKITNGGDTAQQLTFQPSSFSIGRIAYIIDGYASEASVFTLNLHDEGMDAQATIAQTGESAPVIVWPSAYSHYVTDVGLAGVLVHEADHTRFGGHSCGKIADQFEDGPYGTEIQYLAKMWRTGHPSLPMSSFDRDSAWDKATDKLSQICDPRAQKRLWNNLLTDPSIITNAVVNSATNTWQLASGPYVTDISTIADGSSSIFGVGSDGVVYRSSAGGGWIATTPSPAAPAVGQISVMPNGTIFGIGPDNAVYRNYGGYYGYNASGGFGYIVRAWTQFAVPWVKQISVTPDGTVYGIGSDNAVWRSTGGGWSQVAGPYVTDISVTPDGTIYGLGTDQAVWRTTPYRWQWDRITEGAVQAISVTPSGFIYGLGLDNNVYMTRPSADWQHVADSWVQNISVTPDGNIFAIGGNNAVYVHGSKK